MIDFYHKYLNLDNAGQRVTAINKYTNYIHDYVNINYTVKMQFIGLAE